MSKSDREFLASQRVSIREHIEKYEAYQKSAPEAVNMALRTIRNCQAQIQKTRNRFPYLEESWEDTWKPPEE